jgi:hypothetical protein
MDIHQEILLENKAAFREEKITFAYPTQNLNMAPTEIWMAGNLQPSDQEHKSNNVGRIN